MSVKDVVSQSSRLKEDEHFRKKDEECIKKMRHEAELEALRTLMANTIGVTNEQVLEKLQELGYTQDTVKLLYLAPLVYMAWIEGHVTQRERKRILEAAQLRGIEEGSLAYSRLSEWLTERPPQDFFERTLSVIGDLLKVMPVEQGQALKEDLVSCCSYIAAASGGILGLGQTISDTEQALLKHIACELEDPRMLRPNSLR